MLFSVSSIETDQVNRPLMFRDCVRKCFCKILSHKARRSPFLFHKAIDEEERKRRKYISVKFCFEFEQYVYSDENGQW